MIYLFKQPATPHSIGIQELSKEFPTCLTYQKTCQYYFYTSVFLSLQSYTFE